jgi:crossover junction endodeoxyribonuclease RuvC
MARGVPIGLAAALGWQVAEYPPALVKRTLVGTGRAEKQQMQYMIQLTLGLTEPPGEDEADALSVAVTHLRVSALAMVTPTVAVARMPVESAPLTPAKAAWLAAMAGGKR